MSWLNLIGCFFSAGLMSAVLTNTAHAEKLSIVLDEWAPTECEEDVEGRFGYAIQGLKARGVEIEIVNAFSSEDFALAEEHLSVQVKAVRNEPHCWIVMMFSRAQQNPGEYFKSRGFPAFRIYGAPQTLVYDSSQVGNRDELVERMQVNLAIAYAYFHDRDPAEFLKEIGLYYRVEEELMTHPPEIRP